MKKLALLLIVIFTFLSCFSDNISIEKIKSDLIGTSIEGAWNFDAPSEFLDVNIISKKKTDNILEVNTEFILQGYRTKKKYYLNAILIYKKDNSNWKYVKGNIVQYKENIKVKSLQDWHISINQGG